jgi:2-oxoglutarate dehydrogenase E1 component
LSRIPGYLTGGTVHIIANNQLGFTTDPIDGRSTIYASDLAKGFKIPIIHVNADDPIACIEAGRIAMAYRLEFQKDFLIDLIGYRRYGHNEGDEPRFTQPMIYKKIDTHATVRQRWADTLVEQGLVDEALPQQSGFCPSSLQISFLFSIAGLKLLVQVSSQRLALNSLKS